MSSQTVVPSSTADNAVAMELGELTESAAETPSNDAAVDASVDASADVVVSKDSDSADTSSMPADPMLKDDIADDKAAKPDDSKKLETTAQDVSVSEEKGDSGETKFRVKGSVTVKEVDPS